MFTAGDEKAYVRITRKRPDGGVSVEEEPIVNEKLMNKKDRDERRTGICVEVIQFLQTIMLKARQHW